MTTEAASSVTTSTMRPADGCSAVPGDLLRQYERVRSFSRKLCAPLAVEDHVVQTMPDVSPTKWHLAHTTWFFETLVLREFLSDYRPLHEQYVYLFNSYYNAVGPQFSRPHRGTLSRPTVGEVYDYRSYVDEHMRRLFLQGDFSEAARLSSIVEIGLHHEQQHQELMLTDIKHVFACNPLRPVYARQDAARTTGEGAYSRPAVRGSPAWQEFSEGVYEIGCRGAAFSYDNERPRHKVFLQPFAVASRPVTNEEFLAFIEDAGYDRPELWLSDGWNAVQEYDWRAPLYWEKQDGRWRLMTLSGMRDVEPSEPVCHVSFYEADAFARWAGARLLTEAEWEVAAAVVAVGGNLVEEGLYHPAACNADEAGGPAQMFGDVWEWTASPYTPYPGFQPAGGALGEYNGKFMCNQMVLRGGSCATSVSHIRPTYRNFFPPAARWQFSGVRLGRSL